MTEAIASLIRRRRRQILVHSFLYYRLNTNIIDDATYDRWSKELAGLQKEHPEIAGRIEFAEDFANFDGSSGFDLPHHLPEIQSRGHHLLAEQRRRTNK